MSTELAVSLDRSGTARLFLQLAFEHSCYSHPFFDILQSESLSKNQVAALLRNYDAHASVLRRLLLKAANIMPEAAVPLVLENVRNEYGNGDYACNHQSQLRDLSFASGVSTEEFRSSPVKDGVRKFIKDATKLYSAKKAPLGMRAAAVAAGAITATEILAIKEFICMQSAFARRGLQHHIWFHHVNIEQEHCHESLELALYFADSQTGLQSVEYGLTGILDSNNHLYDGFVQAIADAKH